MRSTGHAHWGCVRLQLTNIVGDWRKYRLKFGLPLKSRPAFIPRHSTSPPKLLGMRNEQLFDDIHNAIPALRNWIDESTPASPRFHGVHYDEQKADRMFAGLPSDTLSRCANRLSRDDDVDALCNRPRLSERVSVGPASLSQNSESPPTAPGSGDVLKTWLDDFCSALGAENVDPNRTDIGVIHAPKPAVSYLRIIAQSILSSDLGRVLLNDIYAYVLRNYPYYERRKAAWRNSIRHNLSVNECFAKAGRAPTGRGHYWRIHADCVAQFAAGDFSRRPRHLVTQHPDARHQHPATTYNHQQQISYVDPTRLRERQEQTQPRPQQPRPQQPDTAHLRMLTGGKRTAKVFSSGYDDTGNSINLVAFDVPSSLKFQYHTAIPQNSPYNSFNSFSSGPSFVRC